MAGHTPGPWEVWEFGDPRVVNSEIGWTIYTVEDPAPDELATHVANARLISAAPDMLEALEALVWVSIPSEVNSPEDGQLAEAMRNARAAIAKARGEA